MSAALLTLARAETFASATRLVEAQGWSWSVDGGPGDRTPEAYVHIPGGPTRDRRCFSAEGKTPELALIAAYRIASRAALPTNTSTGA